MLELKDMLENRIERHVRSSAKTCNQIDGQKQTMQRTTTRTKFVIIDFQKGIFRPSFPI